MPAPRPDRLRLADASPTPAGSGGAPRVVAVIGNPRVESRTHGVARTLAREIAAAVQDAQVVEVDLAAFGPRVLDPSDAAVSAAAEQAQTADVLVVASPTYKATYTGLLKAFLDRIPTGALGGAPAVPLLLGASPEHRLAVDVHLTPLLAELGASVPVRGLFVLEREVDDFPATAAAWASVHGPLLAYRAWTTIIANAYQAPGR